MELKKKYINCLIIVMSAIAIHKNNRDEPSKPETDVSAIREFVEPPPVLPPPL